MNIDFKNVLDCANAYKPAISRFLRDLIAIPSESRGHVCGDPRNLCP